MLENDLVFREQDHRYFLVGKPIPGVTRVLADMGYYRGVKFYTDRSRERGRAVHLATELIDQHCPDALELHQVEKVMDIAPALSPYVSGYLLFLRETGFRAEHIEQVTFSQRLRVAGKFDKWGRYRDGTRVLLDTKTWTGGGVKPQRSAELQTGLYQIMAAEHMGLETDLRVVLRLPGDGGYRLYRCQDPMDLTMASAICRIYWDRRQNGLIENCDDSELELIDATE